ncbi:MAG: glutamate-1-semialdehyde 2,1-aminomutase [Devosiaceae bacterium]|nr:glutamate-1-semialdehyde 2,1-aminomutase [Devosiaceae bacterium]
MTQELFDRALRVTPAGVHSPVRSFKGLGRAPIFFKSAKGAILFDVEGNEYIDFCQSFGPLILGHRDKDVEEEVKAAISDVWSLGAADPYSLELAEWIVENIAPVERVRFVSSGTEAVMSALRLARGYTNRSKIVKFDGCYHGHVDSMLVKAGSGLANGQSSSSSSGVSDKQASDTLILPLGDEEALEKLFAIEGKNIAALIIEPLPANFGLLPLDIKFLEKLRELTQQYNSLLIFDEVISGFRLSKGGMAEITNITPDLITYGKVIGGGFPVGAFGGRADIMDQIAPSGAVYQAGTLSANPISMRAGLATLKKAAKAGQYEALNKRATYFANELRNIIKKSKLNIELVQVGSLLWLCSGGQGLSIKSPADFPKNIQEGFKPLFLALLNEGIYLAPNGYEVMFLSHAHDDEILTLALSKFERALARLTK